MPPTLGGVSSRNTPVTDTTRAVNPTHEATFIPTEPSGVILIRDSNSTAQPPASTTIDINVLKPGPLLSQGAVAGITVVCGILLLALFFSLCPAKRRRYLFRSSKHSTAPSASAEPRSAVPAITVPDPLPLSEKYTIEPPVPAVLATRHTTRESRDLRSISPHTFMKHTSIDTLPEEYSFSHLSTALEDGERPPASSGIRTPPEELPENQVGSIFFMDSDLSIEFRGRERDDDTETIQPVSRAVFMARILSPGSSPSINGSIGGSSAPRAMVVGATTPRSADDLHVEVGQSLRVLVEYEDGWALCANDRGQQGLVPMSCLDIPQVA